MTTVWHENKYFLGSTHLKYSFADYHATSGFYHAKVRHYSTFCPKTFVERYAATIAPNYSNHRIDLEKGSVVALKVCFKQLHKDRRSGKEHEDDLIRRECTNPIPIDTVEDAPLWSRVYSKSWVISIETISLNGQRHKIEDFLFNIPTVLNFSDKTHPIGEDEAKELAESIILRNFSNFQNEFKTFLTHALKRFEES